MSISNETPRNYKNIVAEYRALEVLIVLREESTTNSRVMESWLRERGLGGSENFCRECLERLQMDGLVVLNDVEDVQVIRLTEKGERVASGEERIEGIARPNRDLPRR